MIIQNFHSRQKIHSIRIMAEDRASQCYDFCSEACAGILACFALSGLSHPEPCP